MDGKKYTQLKQNLETFIKQYEDATESSAHAPKGEEKKIQEDEEEK